MGRLFEFTGQLRKQPAHDEHEAELQQQLYNIGV
jgi:hypothetical protein